MEGQNGVLWYFRKIMDKVVIDTNVIIDGVRDENSSGAKIVEMVLDGEITAFSSYDLIREYRLIIERTIVDAEYKERMERFMDALKEAEPAAGVRMVEDDPQDDKIFALALGAGAEAIITADNHLLKLDGTEGIRVMPPKEFIAVKENEDEGGWARFVRMIGL